ncbi:MAG: transcription elongation factor GreA [Armatimonas sp.]
MVVMEQVEEEIVLTPSGRLKMEEELERLITVDRPEVAARIRDAKDYGELAENPEYESAKTAQAFIEGRIMDLKSVLGRARILHEEAVSTDKVAMGLRVEVRDLDYSDDWALTLVSAYEADPDEDRISDQSPIGRALMGHRVGDTVTVNTPSGTARYEILGISH